MKQPHIIIDYAHDTPVVRGDLLRHIANMQQHFNGAATIEVMAYGEGIHLLLKDGGLTAEEATLPAIFLACQNTMKRKGIAKDMLLLDVQSIPSGLGHIVDRQLQGWAYIKE